MHLQGFICVKTKNPFGQGSGDLRGCEIVNRRQQPIGMWHGPLTFVVKFADDARTYVFPPVVEFLLHLVLDHVALFFNHHNFFETFGEVPDAVSFKRPDHADLVNAQANLLRFGIVNTKHVQSLTNVQVGFARRDNADTRLGRVHDHAVNAVGLGIGERGVEFVFQQSLLLSKRWVWPTDIQAALGDVEIRSYAFHTEGVNIDNGSAFYSVRYCLKCYPATGIA